MRWKCIHCIYLEKDRCHLNPVPQRGFDPEDHWCSHLTREAMDNVGTFDVPEFIKIHVKPYDPTTSTFRT